MPLGKYGRMRQTFLQERHKGRYTSMLLTGRLEAHLREIDQQAQEQIDRIVADLKKQNHVDEAMKARDQMGWVQAVNSFTAQAEEMVLNEIVYKQIRKTSRRRANSPPFLRLQAGIYTVFPVPYRGTAD